MGTARAARLFFLVQPIKLLIFGDARARYCFLPIWMKRTNYSRRKVPCSTLLRSTSVFLPSFLRNLPTDHVRIIQEQKRGREYEFATSFVQTKKNANLSSPLDFVLLFLDRSKLAGCHNWPAGLVSSQMEDVRSTFYTLSGQIDPGARFSKVPRTFRVRKASCQIAIRLF